MNSTPKYKVPELEEGPAVTRPAKVRLSLSIKDWPIWLAFAIALSVGIYTFVNTDRDIVKTLSAAASIIGVAGIWFAYIRLTMSYQQQESSMTQRERHYQDSIVWREEQHKQIIQQRDKQHKEMLDFYKKKASQDIITEWYKELGHKTLVARNFRTRYINGLGRIDFNKLAEALQRIDDEELELQKANDTNIDLPENKFVIRKNIIPILNYFEKISVAILDEAVDENMLKLYFYDTFDTYELAFITLIRMRQQNAHNGTPDAFENFLKVVDRWRASKQQTKLH